MGVDHCKYKLFCSGLANTSKKTWFKDGVQVHYERQPSFSQWTLTNSRGGMWTPNSKFKILHVCIPISCTIMIPGPHPPCHLKTKQNKTICSLATPTWKIHFCNLWTFSRFFFGIESFFCSRHIIMKSASIDNWLISTNVNDSGLKCFQHQGCYEIHWNTPPCN